MPATAVGAETEVGQRFVIDLELFTDLSESSRTDKLADTVSYSNVVATATAAFKDVNYKLLERAAVRWPMPSSRHFRASAPSRSPCTSRMRDRRDLRRCRRGADAQPEWLARLSHWGAMSATSVRHSKRRS